jgi:hypothetical protein
MKNVINMINMTSNTPVSTRICFNSAVEEVEVHGVLGAMG